MDSPSSNRMRVESNQASAANGGRAPQDLSPWLRPLQKDWSRTLDR